ncbi:MipA/OmpV family protein [Bordetella sp. N]|uniref:MipA/OmpV family protein n=1 Tax=Bordetella sp. N TaxID=1746199 RepID=UPI00351634E3
MMVSEAGAGQSMVRGARSMALAAALAAACGAAQAENSIGLGVGAVPEYEGSHDYHAVPVPLVKYESGAFFIDGDGGLPVLGLRTHLAPNWQAGVFAGLRLGRDADDHDRLNGLDDIDPHGTAGAFLRWNNDRWHVDLTATQALRSGYGTRAELRAWYEVWRSGRSQVRLGAGTAWGSHDDMSTWFSVDSSEAARSQAARSDGGLRAYSAGAGFRSATLSATWRYDLTPRWTMVTSVGVRTLLGDARDSPIVERRTSPYGMVGLSYRF